MTPYDLERNANQAMTCLLLIALAALVGTPLVIALAIYRHFNP